MFKVPICFFTKQQLLWYHAETFDWKNKKPLGCFLSLYEN